MKKWKLISRNWQNVYGVLFRQSLTSTNMCLLKHCKMSTENISMWILVYISLHIISIETVSANKAEFDLHQGMRNTYCSDHANATGVVTSLLACGVRCMAFAGCLGFFYDTVTKTGSVVTVISIPHKGCVQEMGMNYYVRRVPAVFDKYSWTQTDQDRFGTDDQHSVCTSYPYHVFHTDLGSTSQLGCDDGFCCTTKGCYSGAPNLYTGTWHRTGSGRECQAWSEQSPHGHAQPHGTFPPGETLESAENYCRDPDDSGAPWCYTMDPSVRWEFCGIPVC